MAFDDNDTLFSENEYPSYPDQTKKKLARFLSVGEFGADVDLSFEEVKLFRRAAGRLRNDSLESACKDLEEKFETDLVAEEASAPSLSTNLQMNQLTDPNEFDQCTQVYHVTLARDGSKSAFAFVYEAIIGHCYVANIKKGSVRHCVSACRHVKDGAPYILIKTDHGKCEKNLRYDIILNKWEKIPNSKKLSFQPHVIEIQNNVYMFGGQSLDIRKCASGKWRPCAALVHPVFNPMYVTVGNKLTIFDGNSVQLFDATTNKVKLFNTPAIPKGVAVNIANYACVVSPSGIVQFDETTGACSFHSLDATLLKNSSLIGAICHNRKIHIIVQKDASFCVLRLSVVDDFSIDEVCTMDISSRTANFSVLSSCIVQSSHDYRLTPFLNFDEARKLNRRLAMSS